MTVPGACKTSQYIFNETKTMWVHGFVTEILIFFLMLKPIFLPTVVCLKQNISWRS